MSYTLSMARTSSNRLLNRTVRARLPIQREPHWHLIAEGQHLGYRKTGDRQGKWIVRYYIRNQGRRFNALGMADDTASANGTHILSYEQALEGAQKWIAEVAHADDAGIHFGPYRVKDAATAYSATWCCWCAMPNECTACSASRWSIGMFTTATAPKGHSLRIHPC